MSHQNKINDLVKKLNDAREELDKLKATINQINDMRTDDPLMAEVLLSNLAYVEAKKATLERIALNRAFALVHLLGESNKVGA